MPHPVYASVCGHLIRDSDQASTRSGNDRKSTNRYCIACLLFQDYGEFIKEGDIFDPTQVKLQDYLPEQRAKQDESCKKLQAFKEREDGDDSNSIEVVPERGLNPTAAEYSLERKIRRSIRDQERFQPFDGKTIHPNEILWSESRRRVEKLASDYRSAPDVCPFPIRRDTKSRKEL